MCSRSSSLPILESSLIRSSEAGRCSFPPTSYSGSRLLRYSSASSRALWRAPYLERVGIGLASKGPGTFPGPLHFSLFCRDFVSCRRRIRTFTN